MLRSRKRRRPAKTPMEKLRERRRMVDLEEDDQDEELPAVALGPGKAS